MLMSDCLGKGLGEGTGALRQLDLFWSSLGLAFTVARQRAGGCLRIVAILYYILYCYVAADCTRACACAYTRLHHSIRQCARFIVRRHSPSNGSTVGAHTVARRKIEQPASYAPLEYTSNSKGREA